MKTAKKTMSKVAMICILLVLVTVASQWIAISRMRCYVADPSNGAVLTGIPLFQAEGAALWRKGSFQSQTAPEEMTVTFDGKTYTGIYAYSYCTVGESDVVDCYRSKDRYEGWDEFAVIAGTEKVDTINLAGMGFHGNQKNEQTMDSMAVAELAQWWALKYINTEQYVMRQTHVGRDAENDMLLYTYEFVRTVGGRDTTDRLVIQLTDRGFLCQIGGMQSRWVKGKGLVLARLRLVNVEEKLRETLGEKRYQIQSCKYGITPEGKPVILVDCSVAQKFGNVAAQFVIQ